jgi:hypothetical protein
MSEPTIQELNEVRADFIKCYEIANRLASMFPTTPGVWTGTVSERLKVGINALIQTSEDKEFFNEI